MTDNTPMCRDGRKDPKYREDDNHCDHCGSLNPVTFMERLEAGTISLAPSDKNYKVYVHNEGGEKFKRAYGEQRPDKTWTTVVEEITQTKFYFEHLTDKQKQRFIDLYNEQKMKLKYPGHFYRLPYFMAVIPQEQIQ